MPSTQEYNALRQSVAWPIFEEAILHIALRNTLFAVVAENGAGEAIGMGRVLGDNAVYLHIQDVVVRADCQGTGVGTMLMKELLGYIEKNTVKNSNIGLMCSKGREEFYRRFGFVDRPNDKFRSGMIKVIT